MMNGVLHFCGVACLSYGLLFFLYEIVSAFRMGPQDQLPPRGMWLVLITIGMIALSVAKR